MDLKTDNMSTENIIRRQSPAGNNINKIGAYKSSSIIIETILILISGPNPRTKRNTMERRNLLQGTNAMEHLVEVTRISMDRVIIGNSLRRTKTGQFKSSKTSRNQTMRTSNIKIKESSTMLK